MIRFRFLILIILFFSSVSQLVGQTSKCSKAQMREMIQKGFSNKEIFAACNVTSKTEEEKPKKIGKTSFHSWSSLISTNRAQNNLEYFSK